MLPTADDDAVLDVRTFDVQLWAQLSTGRRPNVLTATANVSRGVYERFATQLYRCAQEPAQKQGIAVLDGMGTHALCWCENAEYTIGGNSARGSKAYSQFLREFVEVVRRRLPASQCRSAIATTKRYL